MEFSTKFWLTLCLLVLSADTVTFAQFGLRSDLTKVGPDLNPICLTSVVFLKEFFEKVDLKKKKKIS